MAGGEEAALARGTLELDALQVHDGNGALAVDLGAGFGMHAIPLARRGYSVIALDTSPELSAQLMAAAGSLPVHSVVDDLLAVRRHVARGVQVALCMGDTLTHLSSRESIKSLFADVAAILEQSGIFVVSFRDYSTALLGEHRFIPVASDSDRILTCFLEYSEDFVTVNDLLQTREGARWKLAVSSYRKLRLQPAWVIAAMEEAGLSVSRDEAPGRMVRLTGRKLVKSTTSHPERTLRTRRLLLVATTLAHIEVELRDPQALGALLQASIPASWPPGEYDRDALEFFHERLLAGGASHVGWYGWYALTCDTQGKRETLIAGAGYFGPPSHGSVEIGFSVVPEARGQGYASEMVNGLVAHAFAEQAVQQVIAHTFDANIASTRVLIGCGFQRVGTVGEAEMVEYRRVRG
jgi:RimJ/RimL family protein N-acetyltransferase